MKPPWSKMCRPSNITMNLVTPGTFHKGCLDTKTLPHISAWREYKALVSKQSFLHEMFKLSCCPKVSFCWPLGNNNESYMMQLNQIKTKTNVFHSSKFYETIPGLHFFLYLIFSNFALMFCVGTWCHGVPSWGGGCYTFEK